MRLLALVLALQAPAQAPATPAVAKVVVTPATPTIVVGDSVALAAQALDAAGKPVDARILYAPAGGFFEGTVSRTGVVTGGAPGKLVAAVTAVVPGQKPVIQLVTIEVLPAPAAQITVSPAIRRLVTGQVVPLTADVLSASGDHRRDAVRWTSSAPSVVTVSAEGIATAVAAGKATLTATAGGAKAVLDVAVVPGPLRSLTVAPATSTVTQGDVVHFAITARGSAGPVDGLTPTWSMTGTGRIDQDGAFVAYAPGTYVVSAQVGGQVATATVAVKARDVVRKFELLGTVVRSRFTTEEVWVHPNGKVAYLGSGSGGDVAYVIDVSNPSDPKVVDSLVSNTRRVNDLMTDPEGKVLVHTREGASDRKNGIVIYTLEDPLHPKKVSELTTDLTAGVHSSFLYRDKKTGQLHAFLTNDGTGALHIVNLDDPANPKEVARWKTPRPDAGRSLHDIDVQDGLLYGSWWNDGLVILDVGNGIKGGSPSNPQFVSQYKYDLEALYQARLEAAGGPGYIRGTHTAWRHGKYVFIGDEVFANGSLNGPQGTLSAWGRMQVIDVSDIFHPKSVAYWEPDHGGVHNVWVAGDTLYVGAYNAGFHAFDISGELRGNLKEQGREIAVFYPSSPKANVPNATMTWGVVVKDNLIFINDMFSGLFIGRLGPKSPPPAVP